MKDTAAVTKAIAVATKGIAAVMLGADIAAVMRLPPITAVTPVEAAALMAAAVTRAVAMAGMPVVATLAAVVLPTAAATVVAVTAVAIMVVADTSTTENANAGQTTPKIRSAQRQIPKGPVSPALFCVRASAIHAVDRFRTFM